MKETGLAPADEKLLESVAGRIVRMRMGVPAVFFLESAKPLSFIGSQALVFMEPFVKAFLTLPQYDQFARMMEDRSNVERMIQIIEKMDREQDRREKEIRRKMKEEKQATRVLKKGAAMQKWRWWGR
ncbi:MAG: hypothetical protein KJ970_05325 [Candidatus Eisenbacteria bacterium]|uniref:Uncharacterized protein n=1 Tax=Eiseniibacteriota bacterium TaxID=2212470 RepID=A0A948RUQ0_UNCEI|nr:hypothetical protein [Candidatus Eisenbacteria bacterium]MBU1947671.1 hypothetical protein [Candidatus Eisenbacteria bacterium]MBU2690331.1 hypothetical protein [Candidatus Eisenbacteria bacterium]